MIRIENRQLISASTGPSNDLFIRRISAHSARAARRVVDQLDAGDHVRALAPRALRRGVPGATNSTGIGSGRASSIGARRDDRPRRAGLRDLADAPLERGQPADDLRVPVAGGLEERDHASSTTTQEPGRMIVIVACRQ